MQKTQKHHTANKAAPSKAGTRKPLTPEQRERKNRRDRERRAELRKLAAENRQTDFRKGLQPKQARQARNPKQAHKCGCRGGGCGCGQRAPESPAEFFEQLMSVLGGLVSGNTRPSGAPGFAEVAPGVVRRTIELPGATVNLTVVDAERVDPLSDYSPIPWPVRRELLLARMAREISDIVDANSEAWS